MFLHQRLQEERRKFSELKRLGNQGEPRNTKSSSNFKNLDRKEPIFQQPPPPPPLIKVNHSYDQLSEDYGDEYGDFGMPQRQENARQRTISPSNSSVSSQFTAHNSNFATAVVRSGIESTSPFPSQKNGSVHSISLSSLRGPVLGVETGRPSLKMPPPPPPFPPPQQQARYQQPQQLPGPPPTPLPPEVNSFPERQRSSSPESLLSIPKDPHLQQRPPDSTQQVDPHLQPRPPELVQQMDPHLQPHPPDLMWQAGPHLQPHPPDPVRQVQEPPLDDSRKSFNVAMSAEQESLLHFKKQLSALESFYCKKDLMEREIEALRKENEDLKGTCQEIAFAMAQDGHSSENNMQGAGVNNNDSSEVKAQQQAASSFKDNVSEDALRRAVKEAREEVKEVKREAQEKIENLERQLQSTHRMLCEIEQERNELRFILEKQNLQLSKKEDSRQHSSERPRHEKPGIQHQPQPQQQQQQQLCPLTFIECDLNQGRLGLANQSVADISLAGWSVVSKVSGNRMEFPPEAMLAAGSVANVWGKQGDSNRHHPESNSFLWTPGTRKREGSGDAPWCFSGDNVLLYDPQGGLADCKTIKGHHQSSKPQVASKNTDPSLNGKNTQERHQVAANSNCPNPPTNENHLQQAPTHSIDDHGSADGRQAPLMRQSMANGHQAQLMHKSPPEEPEQAIDPSEPWLVIDIELGDNMRGQIPIFRNANPMELAHKFLQEYEIESDLLEPLAGYIEEQIKETQESQTQRPPELIDDTSFLPEEPLYDPQQESLNPGHQIDNYNQGPQINHQSSTTEYSSFSDGEEFTPPPITPTNSMRHASFGREGRPIAYA